MKVVLTLTFVKLLRDAYHDIADKGYAFAGWRVEIK